MDGQHSLDWSSSWYSGLGQGPSQVRTLSWCRFAFMQSEVSRAAVVHFEVWYDRPYERELRSANTKYALDAC